MKEFQGFRFHIRGQDRLFIQKINVWLFAKPNVYATFILKVRVVHFRTKFQFNSDQKF
jgi:hypothetical protein